MKATSLKTKVIWMAVLLGLAMLAAGCSKGPKDEVIVANVQKMAAVDRSLGFTIQIDKVDVTDRSVDGDKAVVKSRVSGWATHPEVHIGAILPAEATVRQSWAEWEFVLQRTESGWAIEDKFKTKEGFADE